MGGDREGEPTFSPIKAYKVQKRKQFSQTYFHTIDGEKMVIMNIPILRPSNPFRNQGYFMRLAGQRGGSVG